VAAHAGRGLRKRRLTYSIGFAVACAVVLTVWSITATPTNKPDHLASSASKSSSHASRPAASVHSDPTTTTSIAPPLPMIGKVIVIDPGHNGGNFSDPSYINQQVWNGREDEACDTTGTETDSGYTEAQFNYSLALEVQQDLQSQGATVILTRSNNTGIGPCITQRTAIGNDAHAAAALSIHADGGPPVGRGFALLEPVADGPNDAVIASSDQLAMDLRSSFIAGTGMPESTYDGTDAIVPRDDLAGVNLTTVPKVFIECGNMRNATDAALLTDSAWQEKAAAAIATGLETFVLQSGQ
jgi:N-acetylmuramoyl-L-alanine amidase